jgi:hypothetical protein
MSKTHHAEEPRTAALGASFQGLFLRHFMGDSPGTPYGNQGLSDSPDIILNGTSPVMDPSTLTTAQSYTTEPPDTLYVGSGATNYLYVRGLNTLSGPIDARLWLWYAEPNMLLWPQSWISNTIYVNGVLQNWSNVHAASPNQIVVSDAFAVVSPNTPQDHYCTIAISEYPRYDPPSPPFPGYFSNLNDFAAWIQANPNAAWRNTVDQPTTASTWNWDSQINGPDQAGQLNVGVQCQSMPVNSQYRFVVPPGTTTNGAPWPGVDSGVRTVQQPNEAISIQTTWPGAVLAGMNITFYANGQTPQTGATIIPNIGVAAMGLEGLVEDPMLGAKETFLIDPDGGGTIGAIHYQHIIGAVPIRMS